MFARPPTPLAVAMHPSHVIFYGAHAATVLRTKRTRARLGGMSRFHMTIEIVSIAKKQWKAIGGAQLAFEAARWFAVHIRVVLLHIVGNDKALVALGTFEWPLGSVLAGGMIAQSVLVIGAVRALLAVMKLHVQVALLDVFAQVAATFALVRAESASE